jgi:hypothetical protein
MNDAAKGHDWRGRPELLTARLAHLESRRAGIEAAQWQPPTLTIAAQAFLLFVLTNKEISKFALLCILVAGITACLAAILSIVRLRAREVLYSEAIAQACDDANLPDPRPEFLAAQPLSQRPRPRQRPVDRLVRRLGGHERYPTVYLFWIAALIFFIVADIVAFCTSI